MFISCSGGGLYEYGLVKKIEVAGYIIYHFKWILLLLCGYKVSVFVSFVVCIFGSMMDNIKKCVASL